jgi:hypothetical protein
MKKFVTTLVLVALGVVGLAGCGQGNTSYVPAAAAFGGNGQCYMPMQVPQTAWQAIEQQYIAQGWCQSGWTPILIPQQTYMAYYPYYSSPAFYTHYVPATYRTSYVSYERSFGTTYKSQIAAAEKTATYKGSNGKTTTYNKIKTGGGTRTSFGSGTRCDVMRDSLMKPQYAKRGSGGHIGGGSRGGYSSGGGSRTGSSRTGTSRSGSTSGC